jgi:sterol desaturase/sphingolipid hydroxylase (fatty acid hydroxylase superfamily)
MLESPLSLAPLSAQIWVVQMLAYHGIGLWFEWLDRSGRFQRVKFKPMERMSYFEMLPRVLANQIFILLPAMLFMQWAGLAFVGSPRFSLPVFVASVAFMTLGHDVLQYVAHRFILHRPDMMRRLGHAVHHSTIGSLGISACYMSATDFFLEIVCPYLIPLAFVPLGSNFLVHSLVVTAGAFGGLYEHSGYDFALAVREPADGLAPGRLRLALAKTISSEAHAAHHSRGNVSFSDGFGSSNICDTLFRTRFDLVPDRRGARAKAAV